MSPRKGGGGAGALWIVVVAGAPVVLPAIHFPHRALNVLVWIAPACAAAMSFLYAGALFVTMAFHMTPAARAERQHHGPGLLDPANYDEAGRAIHRQFVRAVGVMALFWATAVILAFVFPP